MQAPTLSLPGAVSEERAISRFGGTLFLNLGFTLMPEPSGVRGRFALGTNKAEWPPSPQRA
jgi:hypothetical protein